MWSRLSTVASVAGAMLAVMSSAGAQTFSNATPITIADNARASLYPSSIAVTGVAAPITEIRVTITGISHTYVGDVIILLEAPNGAAIKLYEADVNNSSDMNNLTLLFSTESRSSISSTPTSGDYKPTGGTYAPLFPAPPAAGASSFAPVIGASANGTWNLYVMDRNPADAGSIAGGWSIQFFSPLFPPGGMTYQGRLDGANPGDDVGLRMSFYDDPSTLNAFHLLAPAATMTATVANDGTITVPVTLPPALSAVRKSFLNVEVASPVGGAYQTLTPRTELTSTPMALMARDAMRAGWADFAAHAKSSTIAASAEALTGPAANTYALRDGANTFTTGDQVVTTGLQVGFGTIGNGVGTAENTDVISLRRVNPTTNQSELRLTVGDDPSGAGLDAFSFGTTSTGTNYVETFRFQSNGVAIKPGGGSWSAPSDRRLKHDIQPLSGSLDRLLGLHGVTFEYNDPKRAGAGEGTMMGFVAQDVEPIFPRWVSTSADGYKMLTITGFEALAVEALRELRAEKDAQIAAKDAEISELRGQVEELSKRLDRIESQAK